jgi:hypothetical protein
MAEPDETPRPSGSGLLDPLIGAGFFSPNLSLEEIKRRRAIAGALASRARPFPKTIGEGMTYFGESIADAINDYTLGRGERAYNAKRDADFPGATPAPTPAATPPPVAAVEPPVAPPAQVAAVDPLTVEPASGPANRDVIARGIMARNGAMPPPPPPPAMNTGAPAPVVAQDAGETFAKEGNPPIVSNIRPMVMAQAAPRQGLGRVPGPFDPRAPEPATAVPPPPGIPEEPQLAPETPREQALKAYQRQYRDDPAAVQNAQQQIDALAGARQRDWTIKHEKWKVLFGDVLRQRDPKYRQDLEDAATKARREGEDRTEFPLGGPKEHQAVVKESYENVKNIPKAQAAVNSVKQLLASDAGMFTGSDANIKLSLAKWAQTLGAPYNPAVSNTETFRGLIVPILSALRPAIVGPGAQSLPELKLLQDAAAGNITLDRRSIENIMTQIEKQGVLDAVNHQRVIAANAGRGPRSEAMRQLWSSSFPLPMDKLVPRSAATQLREEAAKVGDDPAKLKELYEEFDEDYATPGLAQRMLGGR